MSLNGWYKNSNETVPSLYQFTNDNLQVNISKVIASGLYSGEHFAGTPPIWVAYTSQDEMNTIWDDNYSGATPLPGKL